MPAEALTLYDAYSRAQIHDVFEPGTLFTPQAGTWGLHGIVRIDGRPRDFVLIVTFGQSQGEHTFDEGISTEGILRWQTQPRQGLANRTVRALIDHDEDCNSVYLFLRTTLRVRGVASDYTYLGPLKYLGHDTERQNPVHFAWQLLRWPIPEAVLAGINLTLEREGNSAVFSSTPSANNTGTARLPQSLIQELPPRQRTEHGESTPSFRASKRRRRSEQEDHALGMRGELLILERERSELSAAGRPDLAELVTHTAAVEGDGAGFDIASFFPDGRPKYVEVKTTSGPKNADFFISANEVAFAASHVNSYELCRIFDYDSVSNSGRFYSISGLLFAEFVLTPIQFRVRKLIST